MWFLEAIGSECIQFCRPEKLRDYIFCNRSGIFKTLDKFMNIPYGLKVKYSQIIAATML